MSGNEQQGSTLASAMAAVQIFPPLPQPPASQAPETVEALLEDVRAGIQRAAKNPLMMTAEVDDLLRKVDRALELLRRPRDLYLGLTNAS